MFLTRFLNQCKSHSSVGMLLPKSISRSVFPAGISRTDHDDELIEMFKREDEYRLLMAQVTFNSMGL